MKGVVIVTCARSGSTRAVAAELADDAEDVVPAAGVEPGRVVAQLPEDLLHLEGGEDVLDQHGGADRAARDAERLLGVGEDLVPQLAPRGGSRASAGRSRGRCRARAARGRCGRSRGRSRRGWPTPARRPPRTCLSTRCQPRGRTIRVATSGLSWYRFPSGMVNAIRRRTASIRLTWPATHVVPGGGVGVLEVGHEDPRARVEGVDHHLALDRAGDLDPAVLEVGRRRCHPPLPLAHRAGGGEEVGGEAAVEVVLALNAQSQQVEAGGLEVAAKVGDEGQRLLAQHLVVALSRRRQQADGGTGAAGHHTASLNCSSSVEPSSARMESSAPPVTTSATCSK